MYKMSNDPSPELVILTTAKINNYLRSQNQNKSHISEAWVLQALKDHIMTSKEVGLILSNIELAERVATIAIRRIRANIVTAERFQKDWQALLPRPHMPSDSNYPQTEVAQISNRGELALRQRRSDLLLPDRHIELNL